MLVFHCFIFNTNLYYYSVASSWSTELNQTWRLLSKIMSFVSFFLHTASRLNMIGLLTWIKSPLNLYFCIHHTPLVNTMIVANFPCDLIFYHFFIITVIEPFKDLFFDPKSKSIDFNLSSQVIYKIKLTVWQTLFFKLFYAFIKIQKKLSLNNKHWL